MFSKLMKKTIAVAAIAAMTSVMAAVATPWWSIDFNSYTDGAKVSASTETQGTWTQQEDDLSVVTSQSLSLNTQGEDLLWTPNAPAESYDSVILDADVKFVASDVEPTTDNSMQTAIYLKATDDGDVLCVYQATEDGPAWEAKDAFTIADGDTKKVTITIDYSDETPMVTLTIGDTSVEYPVANVADKVSSVAFRGTGVVDNFKAQTSVNVTYVADVDGQGFNTYADALAYVAANGGTLTITGDSAEELSFGTFTFTQDATIDLGGKEITAAFVVDNGAQFSIDNGTVTAPAANDVIYIKDGKATVGADATLIASTDCAVFMKNLENADAELALDVYGTLVGAEGFGTIQGNGSNLPASVINIYDGASVTNEKDLAIYHPQNGTLTIGAATIEGTTGIEMRAGNLVVNEGAIIEGTAEFSATPNGNGSTVLGAAIALSQHTTEQPTSVTVNGGTLKGARAFYQDNLASGTSTSVSATIAAGTTLDGAIEVAEEGFMMPQAVDGSYTLIVSLASVDGQKFETYAEAFDYVVANGGDLVITGASDETLGVYNITKNATIDLGGQSITTAFVVDGGAQFSINNGTVTAPAKNDVIYIKNGKATVGAGATLIASTDCAVFMKNLDNAEAQLALDVYGTLVGAEGFGTIQGNGSNKPASVINIYDGATVTNAADLAIYHPQNGTLTIGAATITGTTGIEMRAGNLVVDGAIIEGTAEFSATPNGNGSTVLGAAIALSQHTTEQPTSVTVNGGTLKGARAFYQDNLASGTSTSVSATIAAGTTLDGAIEVAEEGFVMPEAADGSYTLATANFIVAGMPYDTFAAAYDAAAEDATIEVYTDFAASEIITIAKGITIDGNGHTLTSTASRAINIDTTGDVVINDLTIVAKGDRAVNIINQASTVTLNNVTASAKNNAVMVATSAAGANLTVNDSDLTGLAVVNVAAPNADVEINNTNITNVDANPNENYGAISTFKTATGATVVVNGGKVVVADDSAAAFNATADSSIVFNGTEGVDKVMTAAAYIGDAGFETLQEAIDDAKAGQTIILNADNAEDVAISGTTTIDLNDFDATGTFTLTDTAAKLYAAQGLNVVTNVEGYEVVFAEGCYSVQEKVVEVEFAPVKTTSIVIDGNTAKLTIDSKYTEVKVYFKETLDAEWEEVVGATIEDGVITVDATTATGFFTVHAR